MDELKLKRDDDSNDQGAKKSIVSLSELAITAVIMIPLYMLLVYIGIATYTLKSILAYAAGMAIGWVFMWLMIRKRMLS